MKEPAQDKLKFFELAPAWAREMFTVLTDQIDKLGSDIMAQVKVEQADLDNLQSTLATVADDLEAELAALNVPAADLAGVQAVVDRLRSDVAVPTPVTPPSA